MIYATSEQLIDALDGIGRSIWQTQGVFLKHESEDYIMEKRRKFRGDAYLDQIERNAVYLTECTDYYNMALTQYLVEGEPQLANNLIENFIDHIRTEYAQPAKDAHVKFIRTGVETLPVDYNKYGRLRDLRLSGDILAYIKDLELGCKYSQATLMLSETFLRGCFTNKAAYSGCAKAIPNTYELVSQRISIYADLCTGNFSLGQK